MRVFRPVSKRFPITGPFGSVNPNLRGGKPHRGVDIGCPIGTPVWACFDGVIKAALRTEQGEDGARLGNRVALDTPDGQVRALHFHLSSFKCEVGQKVKEGDLIALSGDTGIVTGPHLCFGLRKMPEYEPIEPEFKDEKEGAWG